MRYSQPQFYRFNEDSILLARYILGLGKKISTILDWGCGCGVIGLEIAQRVDGLSRLDFIEKQEEFLPHLKENIQEFFSQRSLKVQINPPLESQAYDLIVSNPPYYLKGTKRESCYKERNLCLFMSQKERRDFLHFISKSLSKTGEAYFCLNTDHDWKKILDEFSNIFRVEHIAIIKHLVLIHLQLNKK